MGEHAESIEETIHALFRVQRLAVLSTHSFGQPHASLVAFAASDDLRYLYFATARTTRKFHNLDVDPRVALLMDTRSNLESDIHTAIAVTATGRAGEVSEPDKEPGVRLCLSRHPCLQDFIRAQSCALIHTRGGRNLLSCESIPAGYGAAHFAMNWVLPLENVVGQASRAALEERVRPSHFWSGGDLPFPVPSA